MSTFSVSAFREDIDILDSSNANKFAENFNLTMDVIVDKNHCNDITNPWDSGPNEKATRQLLFTTSEEYLQCQEDFGTFVEYFTLFSQCRVKVLHLCICIL